MKRILFFIIGIASIQFVFAQSPSLKTSVDKRAILIGEQIQFNVQATFPSNSYSVNWFNVPDSFNHFEVVKRGKIDSVEKNGTSFYTQTITLTSFDSGLNILPSLPVQFQPYGNNTEVDLSTDSIPVNVSYSPLDSSKPFHDIKTIIEVKEEMPLWVWIAAASLLLLLILLIYYIIKYLRRKKKDEPLFKSRLSPYDEAMQALDKLQNEQLLYKGEVKQYHIRLSGILKRYLSRKLQKNMLSLTSSEVLVLLNDTLLSKENTALAAGSLRMADAVKFAKYFPHKEESESSLLDVKKVIENFDKLIFDEQKK